MELNEVIQFFRKQKGWTQKELAEKMMASEKAISAYETGSRGISTSLLAEFAKVFEKQTKDFFDKATLYDEKEIFESNGDIIWVTYVSYWDGGYAEFSSRAKYNKKENIVYDIEIVNVDGFDLDICEREYIILPDETEKDTFPEDEEDYYLEEWKKGEIAKVVY